MARIKVDLDRTIGAVDRRIFGGFIEHLGRCIYGGIYDEGSPLSDERGFRQDVLAAARALRPPLLRYPGGNFVSGYHWTDGVGPREQRPRRLELAWHSEESNRFGTDDFIAYCRALGAEPYICVNLGSGTLDEAQAWVEYCNGTGNTHWANLRRQNGHPEPFNVKYWGLGNEMYGWWQIGALSAEDYVKKATEFAKVMRWTDPSIELVGCGRDGWSDWDRAVLEGLARHVNYHSIHLYTGNEDYWTNVLAPHQAERALRVSQALIDRVRYEQKLEHPIYVAYDEWNVWYKARGAARLEEIYTLADALAVATYLNVFLRHCRTVRLANLAQLANVIAPIFTNPEGLFLQTIYHPLRLYAEHTQALSLDVWVDCEAHVLEPAAEVAGWWPHRVADLGPFQLLDVSATRDADRRELVLGVVNRDPERTLTATIELAEPASVKGGVAYEVNGGEPQVVNSFQQPETVAVQERRVEAAGEVLCYAFPAHSLTVLKLRLAT